MIAVLQRVSEAKVEVRGGGSSSIGKGLLVLLCALKGDGEADVDYITKKTAQLRIFEDEAGKMNRSVMDIGGEVLVVSQFTLAAATRKGNRPSFDAAEAPERARELCDAVVRRLGDAFVAKDLCAAFVTEGGATGTLLGTAGLPWVHSSAVASPVNACAREKSTTYP